MQFLEDFLSITFFQTEHYRHKRSIDFTNVKSTKPTIATHDVAPQPSLIDIEYPTTIDSLLSKNESTSTNGKYLTDNHKDTSSHSDLSFNSKVLYSNMKCECAANANKLM